MRASSSRRDRAKERESGWQEAVAKAAAEICSGREVASFDSGRSLANLGENGADGVGAEYVDFTTGEATACFVVLKYGTVASTCVSS